MNNQNENDIFPMELVKSPKQIEFDAFVERLKKEVVRFCYTKKYGTTRVARGTLCPDFISEAGNHVDKKEYGHTQIYFDLDAENGLGDWRAFIIENFISDVK